MVVFAWLSGGAIWFVAAVDTCAFGEIDATTMDAGLPLNGAIAGGFTGGDGAMFQLIFVIVTGLTARTADFGTAIDGRIYANT